MKTLSEFLVCLGTICILVSLNPVRAHLGPDHSHDEAPKLASNWTHGTILKKFVGVDLNWIASDPTYVTMEMSTKTRGYVSVGFCPVWHGSMEGCDIVVGWVDDSGVGHIVDYHATANVHPIKDTQQDYILVSAIQEDWLTKITFKRKWNTDDTNDANLEKDAVQLIWSWNPEDVKDGIMGAHDRNTRGHTNVMISLKNPPPETKASALNQPTTKTPAAHSHQSTNSSTTSVYLHWKFLPLTIISMAIFTHF